MALFDKAEEKIEFRLLLLLLLVRLWIGIDSMIRNVCCRQLPDALVKSFLASWHLTSRSLHQPIRSRVSNHGMKGGKYGYIPSKAGSVLSMQATHAPLIYYLIFS